MLYIEVSNFLKVSNLKLSFFPPKRTDVVENNCIITLQSFFKKHSRCVHSFVRSRLIRTVFVITVKNKTVSETWTEFNPKINCLVIQLTQSQSHSLFTTTNHHK